MNQPSQTFNESVDALEKEAAKPILKANLQNLRRSDFRGTQILDAMAFIRKRALEDIEIGFYAQEGQSEEFVKQGNGQETRVTTHELDCLRTIATNLAIRYFHLLQDFWEKRSKTSQMTPAVIASIKEISITAAAIVRQMENALPNFATTEEKPKRELSHCLVDADLSRLFDFEKIEAATRITEKFPNMSPIEILKVLNQWETMFITGKDGREVQVCKNGLVGFSR